MVEACDRAMAVGAADRVASVARTTGRLGRRLASVLLPALVCAAASAAPLTPAARAEIDALLSRLETSGCEFYRNGSWHAAVAAAEHLRGKLAYVDERKLVASADEFIAVAASRSSVSGTPYLVRCGSQAPEESGTWLRGQLRSVRGR